MAKASAPSRDSSHAAHTTRPHAHRKAQSPLGPALKQAVEQGHAFGEAHVDSVEQPSIAKRLKRLG